MFQTSDLLTLPDLRNLIQRDNNYGVYVLNTARIRTNELQFEQAGIDSPYSEQYVETAIHITIGDATSGINVVIPPMWIPFDLTVYAEASKVLESSNFKSMVEKKFLTLITKEAFDRVMSSEDAKAARKYYERTYSGSSSAGLTPEELIRQLNSKAQGQGAKKTSTLQKAEQKTTLSPVVHSFVEIAADVDHSELFQKYKSVEPKLTDNDLVYLRENGGLAQIKAAATKALKRRTNNEAAGKSE